MKTPGRGALGYRTRTGRSRRSSSTRPRPARCWSRWKAAGLCHSDEHLVTGDMVPARGARARLGMPPIRSRSSAATRAPAWWSRSAPASRASSRATTSRPASSRRAGAAATARPGARTSATSAPARSCGARSPTARCRHHVDGEELNVMAKLGTFCEHTVRGRGVGHQGRPRPAARRRGPRVVRRRHRAGARPSSGPGRRPGDTVVVVGIGGIGINAVQGAKHGRRQARHRRRPGRVQAREGHGVRRHPHLRRRWRRRIPAVTELTWGQMADKVIMTPGVLLRRPDGRGHDLAGKGGTVRRHRHRPDDADGGAASTCSSWRCGTRRSRARSSARSTRAPTSPTCCHVPRGRAEARRADHQARYPLDEINQGYQDMRDGKNIRGVIVFD